MDSGNRCLLFEFLPLEIATKIFSFLQQADCLTCMAVCRAWNLNVPQYSRDVWTELYITNDSIYNNQRWRRCIGQHVRKIVDFSGKPHNGLRELIDCGCDQVTTIEMYDFVILNDTLITLLYQITSQSPVEISIIGCTYGHSFFDLLVAFPNLDRFKILDERYQDAGIPLFNSLPNIPHSLALTRLIVEFTLMDVYEPLVNILKSSPNLQYLAYNRIAIDFDELFSWCPRLVYLEANPKNLCKYRSAVIKQLDLSSENDQLGLRAFIGRDSHNVTPSIIGRHLMRNADTLEHLILGTSQHTERDWSTILMGLQFPNLRRFIEFFINFTGDSMDTMLKHCPSLKELILLGNEGAKINLQGVLNRLPQLEAIELQNIDICHGSAHSIKQLFEQLASNGSKISNITFWPNMHLSDPFLLALPCLQSLKRLELDLGRGTYSDDVLCESIRLLRRTAIENLYLRQLRCVPEAAVTALCELVRLEKLRLHGIHYTVEPGVASLLQIFEHCSRLKNLHLSGLSLTNNSKNDSIACFEQDGNSYEVSAIHESRSGYKIFLQATNKT